MFVVKASLERGLEPPSWWSDKPVLTFLEEHLLSIYFDLGTCRMSGTSPIPWLAVKEYAEYHDINLDYLWNVVSLLDSEYLDYQNRKFEERMNKK